MVTTNNINKIHELVGTIEGYGRNRLTAQLEDRSDREVNVVYNIIRDYADNIKKLSAEERIQLTSRLILGLEHIDRGKLKDLGTYLEVVCFGEPLEAEHIERAGHRRITSEMQFNGASDISYPDSTDPDENP